MKKLFAIIDIIVCYITELAKLNISKVTDNPANCETEKNTRLLSLDVLRGFDMFWIIGGGVMFHLLYRFSNWHWLIPVTKNLHHAHGNGFTAYDLIFPLFVFMSGVTLGLSQKNLWEQEWSVRRKKYRHAIWRLFFLIFLGMVYNFGCGWGDFNHWGGLLDNQGPRYSSVLARIVIAWFCCAMLVWHTRIRWHIVVAITILAGYWFLQVYFAKDGKISTLNTWIDVHFLPGFKIGRKTHTDPEGLISHLPAIVNAICGSLAGRWLTYKLSWFKKYSSPNWLVVTCKAVLLALTGFIFYKLAWLLNGRMPINKHVWTSTFVLVTVGWSCMLLALFYLIIDGWGVKSIGLPWQIIAHNKQAIEQQGCNVSFLNWLLSSSLYTFKFLLWSIRQFFSNIFAPIGANALLVYFCYHAIRRSAISSYIFGFLYAIICGQYKHYFPQATQADIHHLQLLLNAVGLIAVEVIVLRWMYRRKLFINI